MARKVRLLLKGIFIIFNYGFLLIFTLILPSSVDLTPIVGGVQVKATVEGVNKYPFMVSLQDRYEAENGTFVASHFCGGSLISNNWILSAAHCVWRKKTEQIVAVIGQLDIFPLSNYKYYGIKSVEYVFFQPTNLQNDIALLSLQEPYATPGLQHLNAVDYFAKLPNYNMKASRKRPCKILGYGATQHAGSIQSNLREGEVKVISNKQCQDILGHVWAPQPGENTVCALGEQQDTCQGDSGGPLICTYDGKPYIYGIVSHGLTCGVPGVPSIYTVTIPYAEWIYLVVNN